MKLIFLPFAIGLAMASMASGAAPTQQAYLKAAFPDSYDYFGNPVAISGDTVVVGARYEGSTATGVNGDPTINLLASGAAYVFARTGTNWVQQAYLKSSSIAIGDRFGAAVAIDGDTIAVGAPYEASNATGVNGDQTNNSVSQAGAVYVFVRTGTNWAQQAYIKASNTGAADQFGSAVALSGDTLLVGAIGEDSDANGVNGSQTDNSAMDAGAAFVFVRSGTNWSQQAYLKASNSQGGAGGYGGNPPDQFGISLGVSGDIVVVGASSEDSSATGVNGDQNNDNAVLSGAAYVFARTGTNWTQQAYLKASNTAAYDYFGGGVAVFGETIVVGAYGRAAGIGAAYIFTRTGTNWSQQAFLPGPPPPTNQFGSSVAIWSNTVVIGGISGDSAFVYTRNGTNWAQQAQLKASNAADDEFACSVAVWGDTVVVGAYGEDSIASGVNGNPNDDNSPDSGAAYVFAVNSPLAASVAHDGGDGFFIRCQGAPGATYHLLRASTVVGPWSTNATTTASPSGFVEFHDTNAPPSQGFYRVLSP